MCTQFPGTPEYSECSFVSSTARAALASSLSTPACVVRVYSGIGSLSGSCEEFQLTKRCPHGWEILIPRLGCEPRSPLSSPGSPVQGICQLDCTGRDFRPCGG